MVPVRDMMVRILVKRFPTLIEVLSLRFIWVLVGLIMVGVLGWSAWSRLVSCTIHLGPEVLDDLILARCSS